MLNGRLKAGETPAEATAALVVEGVSTNAAVLWKFSQRLGGVDLTEVAVQLARATDEATNVSRRRHEAILSAQHVALNAMFTDLAMLARDNLKGNGELFERLLRLALKAQSQSRATAETLCLMQNPPVFARQVQTNISGGPQQINNGVPAHVVSRARISESTPIELLEAHGEPVDTRTTRAAGASNSPVAPVDPVDRAKQRGRESPCRA